MNTFRTTILLAVLTALLVWLGDMFGGRQGAIMALILAGGMNFVSYWFSDKIVIKMYGGQVYAVSAYVLSLGHIVPENAVLDAASLPKVEMPNRAGFVPDPRPDVKPPAKSKK